jgi:diaminopropionate ammonia-lyase
MELVSVPMRGGVAGGLSTPAIAEAARNALSQWPSFSVTPLLSLDRLARQLDVREIWLKHEGARFGIGSFKALGAAYALESLLKRKSLYDEHRPGPLTVTCASDGNYGRAVAWAARQLGCECVVYLPRQVTEFREKAIQQYGARTVRVAGNYDAAESATKLAAIRHGWVLFSDSSDENYTAIPQDVMAGYCVMLSEIADRLPLADFTHVFLQCGVGAFAGAICDYLHSALGAEAPILVSIEPERAACVFASVKQDKLTQVDGALETIMGGLACGRPSPLAWELLRTRLNFCATLEDAWAVRAVRLLASGGGNGEPVVAGETGAAGLGALLCAADDAQLRLRLGLNSSSRVLLFCTEGATDPGVYASIVQGDRDAAADRAPAADVRRHAELESGPMALRDTAC